MKNSKKKLYKLRKENQHFSKQNKRYKKKLNTTIKKRIPSANTCCAPKSNITQLRVGF